MTSSYTRTPWRNTKKLVSDIFSTLVSHNFHGQKAKCIFFATEIEFLGHIVTLQGIEIPKTIVNKITHLKRPNSIQKMKSFLELINFVAKFNPFLSQHTHAMNNITKKNNFKLVWSDNLQQDFETIKTLITEKTLLHNINYSKQFIIFCDASNYAIGGILCQEIKDDATFKTDNNPNLGNLKAICCFSRILTLAQIHYTTTEKEK
jgi:RNase H-like domain found in reverse transcriptase